MSSSDLIRWGVSLYPQYATTALILSRKIKKWEHVRATSALTQRTTFDFASCWAKVHKSFISTER
jgi:hypothetical protein